MSSPLCVVLVLPASGIYDPAFIAANQEARADNIIKGSKSQQVQKGTRSSMHAEPPSCAAQLSLHTPAAWRPPMLPAAFEAWAQQAAGQLLQAPLLPAEAQQAWQADEAR